MKSLLKQSHTLYLTVITVVLLPCLLVLGMNALILWRAGEFSSSADIAVMLQDQGGVYGSGVHDVRKTLPLNILAERKPKIIAFGSSRPLDFRQEYFTQRFSCTCQAMSLIDDGYVYAETLLDIHTPEVVIFSLDFWWFQEKNRTYPLPPEYKTGPFVDLKKIIKPMALVADGTITIRQYIQLVAGDNDFSELSGIDKEGLLALQRGLGIRKDGSFFAGVRLTDHAEEYFSKYADIMKNPQAYIDDSPRYGPNIKLVDDRFETLRKIIDLFHQKGTKVILILPPIAPPVYEAMDLEKTHARFKELPQILQSYGDEFYDFHDPTKIKTNKCEFADLHHAGDTAYMRLLLQILAENPNSALRPFIDEKHLARYVKEFSGRTTADFDGTLQSYTEKDFLKLGCNK